jgi:transcriptional regulator with XRE-family HTH domain
MSVRTDIRSLRELRKLSQRQLAQALRVSRETVNKWERGHAVPATPHLTALAEVLELSDAELGQLVRSFRAACQSEAA